VKNRGRFDKVVDQNFSFLFHWANTKLFPYRGRSPKWREKLESEIGGT